MVDLSDTIAPKSDQLNADDLIAGEMVLTITRLSKSNSPDQPISIYFDGDNGKPFKPCKSMRRVLVQAWGSDGSKYVGRSIKIYRDEKVKWAGKEVGGIRISELSHIKQKLQLAVTVSKGRRDPYIVNPLIMQETTEITPEIKEAGSAAAALGVDAYKNWLSGLSPDVKQTVKPYHAQWAKIAKDVPVHEDEFDIEENEEDDEPAM
jgi:hypothetical protein